MAPGDTIAQAAVPDDGGGRTPTSRYAAVLRVASLLVGDQDLARSVVDGALGAIHPPLRARSLGAPTDSGLWHAIVARTDGVEQRLAPPATAVPVGRGASRGSRRPGRREVRWALLGLPMPERAVVVLHAVAGLDDARVATALAIGPGDAAARRDAGLSALGRALEVRSDATLVDAVASAAGALPIHVAEADVTTVLTKQPSPLARIRTPEAAAVGAAAVVLTGAFAWLALREPRRPSVLVAPAATTAGRRTTTLPATTVATTASVATTTVTAPATTTAPAAPPTEATSAAAAEAETIAVTEPAPAPRPATTAPRRPPTTATAPPPEPTPGTPAPPTAAPATTPATTPVPTAAPTPTTGAPVFAGLAITTSSCRTTAAGLSVLLEGLADRTTPAVAVTTPWGVFRTFARVRSTPGAEWTLNFDVPTTSIPVGPQSVTVTSGAETVRGSVAC